MLFDKLIVANRKMISYKATGIVLGNCWGGGQGGYPAEVVIATNRASLIHQIENTIKDGSLDSGMGFESLVGALMCVEAIDTREIDGKTFIAIDYEDEYFGDLTPEQEEQLADMKIYS